jgi:chemotaxis protein MotB
MAKKKRCPKHEEHVDETWLIPYADLLTLLLALFIVLFATSQTDKVKLAEMQKVFSIIFTSQKGVMGDASIQPSNQKHSTDNNEKTSDQGEVSKQLIPNKDGELSSIQHKLNQYITMENLPGYMVTSMTDEGLMITIRDIALFPSGSPELLPQAQKIAYDLSIILEKTQEKVQVAGHTDDNPSEGSGYTSNWELSSARAINFLKEILKNPGLNPERFSAVSYGQYQPVVPNITDSDRERNRRVEILIRKPAGQ